LVDVQTVVPSTLKTNPRNKNPEPFILNGAGEKHVPYRNNKLTQLLQDGLAYSSLGCVPLLLQLAEFPLLL
jgi:hypothetical protein